MEALRLMVQHVQSLDPFGYEGDDWSEPIQRASESLGSVERLGDRLHFLFRPEVEAYAMELWNAAHAAWSVAYLTVDRTRYLTEVEENPGHFVQPVPLRTWLADAVDKKQLDAKRYFLDLENKAKQMRDVFEPYLGRERGIGLSESGATVDQEKGLDPLLAKRPPYVPGSPE